MLCINRRGYDKIEMGFFPSTKQLAKLSLTKMLHTV